MRTSVILAIVLLSISRGLLAQNANPFDLLWRKSPAERMVADDTARSGAVALPAPSATAPVPVLTPRHETSPAEPGDTERVASQTLDKADTAAMIMLSPPPAEESLSGDLIAEESKPGGAREVESLREAGDTASSPVTFILIFGIIFAILAWVLSLNRDLLRKIYRAALNENFSALLFREQRFATTQYLYYIVYFAFFINGGLFLYLIGAEYGWTAWAFRSVWSCIGLVGVVYLLRHLSLNILGSTYPVSKETTHFSFSILLHNILLGVALIPVNLFLAYGPEGLDRVIAIGGIVVCTLVYIMRQFRGLVIGGTLIGAHPFHFFIYLCAVEILPLFTLVKFFQN